MPKFKLMLGVILLLTVGILAGSLGTKMYHRHRMERFEPGGPPPSQRTDFKMRRLSEELDLTPAQQVEIRKIVEESDEKIFEIRHRFLPEIKEIMNQSFKRMKSELDAEQQEKLESIKERLRHMHRKADRHGRPSKKIAGRIVSRMKERLNLTPDQEKEVRRVIETAVRDAHREFGKQGPPGHPGGPPFSMRGDQFGPHGPVAKHLAEILTDQQMDEFRKMIKELQFKNSNP